MTEEAKAEVTLEIPSSKDSKEEANPQAEQVIQAAIQTGAAAERTEQAAAEATAAASEAERILTSLRESLKPELEAISQRLANLEAMEEEEISADEEEGTPTIASANVVEIEEPLKLPESQATKQDERQENKRGPGGFLKRVFLNL